MSLSSLRITLTHFALSSYERAFRFPTFSTIPDVARLGSKTKTFQILLGSFWVHSPAHALSYFSQGSSLCLLPSHPWNLIFFTVELNLSSLCSPYGLPLSRKSVALAHWVTLPSHELVMWIHGSVLFPLGKGGSGVLVNCSFCHADATLYFSAGPVYSSFSAEARAILQALCWPRQYQQVCHFSSTPLRLWHCPRHLVFSSVSPITSNSLAHLTETEFSLFLYYQATTGPQTLISSGERRS